MKASPPCLYKKTSPCAPNLGGQFIAGPVSPLTAKFPSSSAASPIHLTVELMTDFSKRPRPRAIAIRGNEVFGRSAKVATQARSPAAPSGVARPAAMALIPKRPRASAMFRTSMLRRASAATSPGVTPCLIQSSICAATPSCSARSELATETLTGRLRPPSLEKEDGAAPFVVLTRRGQTFVCRLAQRRKPAFVALGASLHSAHQRVKLIGDNDDLTTRAIVDVEVENLAARKVLFEILDVFSRRAEKAVDRLPRISDYPRRILRSAKMSKQSRDRAADVLILIDQYEPVFLAVSVRQLPLAFENSDRERDQIGEIDALARGLFFFIEAKDSQELARGLLVQRGTGFSLSIA